MLQRNKAVRPEMQWLAMDCRKLQLEPESIDLIIDKSTMDTLLCGKRAFLNTARMLKQCQRVLKTGGFYMAVSYGEPSNRKFHLERPHLDFEITIEEITYWQAEDGRTMKHWVYLGRKRPGADDKCK